MTARTDLERIKAPMYDGQMSFETYRSEFEVANKANKWSTDEKNLVATLWGAALYQKQRKAIIENCLQH